MSIITWYNAYGLKRFIGHKGTHTAAGALAGFVVAYINPWAAIATVIALAIGKEVADHYKTWEPHTGKSYIPFDYHVYDVIVTTLGGIAGIVTSMFISIIVYKIMIIMGLVLTMAICISLSGASE